MLNEKFEQPGWQDNTDISVYKKTFVARLEKVRRGLGWTKTVLAEKIGVSVNTVNSYSKGVLPSTENMISLANKLNVSIDYLLGRERYYMTRHEDLTLGMLVRQMIGKEKRVYNGRNIRIIDEGSRGRILNTDRIRSFLNQYYDYIHICKELQDHKSLDSMFDVWLERELERLDEMPLEDYKNQVGE